MAAIRARCACGRRADGDRRARVAVARAEDLIIYKAVAFRPQDQQDIERLLVLYGHSIDLQRVRGIVEEFAVALGEAERAHEERIIRRIGPP